MPRKPRRRTWGTGSITPNGDGWLARWRENGRRRSQTFPTREGAEATLARATLTKLNPDQPRDRSNDPTVGTLAKAWLERRMKTNRAARTDVGRWKHLARVFGEMKPHEVDAAKLRRFIEAKLAEGLAASTVGHCIRLISSLFTDLREQGFVTVNPVSTLTRATRRLFKSTYDVSSTPFLSRQEDVERLYRALPEPHSVIFAIGCMAGLRVGEILGLEWKDVDLEGRKIRVHQQAQHGRLTPVKDDEARLAPIGDSLLPVLTAWKLATGGKGLLFTPACPTRGGRPDLGTMPEFVRPFTVNKAITKALKACGLPKMTLYQVTRHSFASMWVMNGGSMEHLAKILGHSSTSVTAHYAHLLPDYFGAGAFGMVTADLSKPAGTVVSLRPESPRMANLDHTQGVISEQQIA